MCPKNVSAGAVTPLPIPAEALLYQLMVALAADTCLPVVLLKNADGKLEIGILNFWLSDEDWYQVPATPETLLKMGERSPGLTGE